MSSELASVERDTRQTADRIIKGFRAAPARASPCVVMMAPLLIAFRSSISRIAAIRAASETSIMRSSYGDLLDVLVAFANSTWTAKERATYESCTCRQHSVDCFQNFYKDLSEIRTSREEYKGLRQIVIQVFLIIAHVGMDIKNNDANIIKLERNKKHGKWPSSPSLFMPHGPATTLFAFTEWARLAKHSAPLHALCEIASCSSFLRSALNEDEASLPLLDTLLNQHLSQLQKLEIDNIGIRGIGFLEQDTRDFEDIFESSWFCDQMNTATATHHGLHTFTSLYHALCTFIPLLQTMPFRTVTGESVAIKFGCVALAIQSSLSKFTSVPVHTVLEPFVHIHDQAFTPYTMLLGSILLRNQQECVKPLCIRTGEQTKTNFKQCSGCRAVRYCSKECQAADWKNHKGVCKLLKVLMPIALVEYREELGLVTPEMMNNFYGKLKSAGITEEGMLPLCLYIASHKGEGRTIAL